MIGGYNHFYVTQTLLSDFTFLWSHNFGNHLVGIDLPQVGAKKIIPCDLFNSHHPRARRFRALAVQMGGVMIKVGQFLSARLDVLPREVTDELMGLQDEVAT